MAKNIEKPAAGVGAGNIGQVPDTGGGAFGAPSLLPPLSTKPRPDARAAVEAMKQFRKGITLGKDITIRELIEEGRRF